MNQDRKLQRASSLVSQQVASERGIMAEPLLDDENQDITQYMMDEIREQEESWRDRARHVVAQTSYPLVGMLCQTL
jgi:hypothetical protein